MLRRPPRSTQSRSSAASDVYKRQDMCHSLKQSLPKDFMILANVGDISIEQIKELKEAGVSGAYHVCRLKEGIDSCMKPSGRIKTIEKIIEAGMDWYTPVSYTHLRAHETVLDLVCRLLLEKKKK